MRISVAFLELAPLEIRCDGADEQHVVTSDAAAAHAVTLHGLLADTPYACGLSSGGWERVVQVRTLPLPPWIPSWALVEDRIGWGAYTLLNHRAGEEDDQKLLIVDPEGRLRWSLVVPSFFDVDSQYLGDGELLVGGGYFQPPTRFDLSGAQLAVGPPSYFGRRWHHHAEQLPTGEVVAMALSTNTAGEEEWDGFTVELLNNALTEHVWVYDSQQGVDEGQLPIPGAGNPDPYHANAIALDGDRVWVNLYRTGQLIHIDRPTGAITWRFGPGGDFALVDANGDPEDPARWFYKAHAPKRLGDRWLFYDNGVERPGGDSSQVVVYIVDEPQRTATVDWSWTEPGWFNPIWGDADWLPGGGVLVTKANHEDFSEVQRTEVVELDAAHEPVWRLRFDEAHDRGYRAQRIDGCAIFANGRYCPALAVTEDPTR